MHHYGCKRRRMSAWWGLYRHVHIVGTGHYVDRFYWFLCVSILSPYLRIDYGDDSRIS